jgi:hypothetical protein
VNTKPRIKLELIAPCGMNCGICMAYLREKDKCPGCRGSDANKKVTCSRCKIKNCLTFKKGKTKKFCFECKEYPCKLLNHLDKRYRTKYHMSMIENLDNIKKSGVRAFVRNEEKRWACQKCGGTICIHRGCCPNCGAFISFHSS